MSAPGKEREDKGGQPDLEPVDTEWGKKPEDHFGYDSDEERLAKRGMEDWELVDKIPESQRGVPKWFIAVVAVVLLVAVGLSFPFWGDRPGYERSWFNWGFVAALIYIAVAAAFVYLMVNYRGFRSSSSDHDEDAGEERQEKDETGHTDDRKAGKEKDGG